MYCPYCGNHCDETHHFCFICGKELPKLDIEDPVMDPPVSEANPTPEQTPLVEPEIFAEESLPAEPACSPEGEIPDVAQPVDSSPAPQPRKGRIWPPILALAVIVCVGLAVFFTGGSQEPSSPTEPAASYFEIDNGVLYFHPEHYTGSEELTIPETVDGQTVTAIADNAFNGCADITTVILPETVTFIGDYAFSSCHNLRGIYIPESVKSIGVYAFADCDSLEAIYLPGSLEAIGHGALDSCDGLNFILFNGTYAQWNELYDGHFSSSVELHTTDGTYYARP